MNERDPVYGTFKNSWEVGPGVGPADQIQAGVNQWDNTFSAGAKVQQDRINRGLDPFTGQPPMPYRLPGPLEQAIGSMLKWALLLPLLLLAAAVVLALALAGLRAAVRGVDPAGLARSVASDLSPPRKLSPPTAYLTEREIAAAAKGPALFQALAKRSKAVNVNAGAYLCALDPQCARKAWEEGGNQLLSRAQGLVLDHARKGKASAAVDLCLLPLWTNRVQPVQYATYSCEWAAEETRSAEVAEIARTLRSPTFAIRAKLAEGSYFADCIRGWRDGTCTILKMD